MKKMVQVKEKNNSLNALKADTHRQYGRFTYLHLIQGALLQRTFRVVVTMRLCQYCINSRSVVRFLLPFMKILHHIAAQRAGMDLSWRTEIGPGLALTHGWGLVVNPHARIGKNVTLFHGVTLGRRDRIANEGTRTIEYPVLEDEVWVGPHAVIAGGVTIGRGCRIAAGAFVTESIPSYSVVLGNPATIAKSNCTPDVMRPAP